MIDTAPRIERDRARASFGALTIMLLLASTLLALAEMPKLVEETLNSQIGPNSEKYNADASFNPEKGVDQIFRQFDNSPKDSFLSNSELANYVLSTDPDAADSIYDRTRGIMMVVDNNHDGKLSNDEMVDFWVRQNMGKIRNGMTPGERLDLPDAMTQDERRQYLEETKLQEKFVEDSRLAKERIEKRAQKRLEKAKKAAKKRRRAEKLRRQQLGEDEDGVEAQEDDNLPVEDVEEVEFDGRKDEI